MKQCIRCEEYFERTKENFYGNCSASDGLQSVCKACDNKASAENYQKHIKDRRKKRAQWQKDNYQKHLRQQQKYANSEKGKETKAKWLERKKKEKAEKERQSEL